MTRNADVGALLDELAEISRTLTREQAAQVLAVARAMTRPIEEAILPGSAVVTPAFAAEFRARLQAHHATYTTPMDRLSFENAFLAASRAAGRSAQDAPSKTTRFYDATVDGEQIALKFEGAKNLQDGRLKISKLSEAAWIQDMRSARLRREKTFAFVDELLEAVQRIFVLRFHQRSPVPRYELVEIPVASFALVKQATVADFDSDGPRIVAADADGDVLRLRIDRSDSKITIDQINKARCIVHADWRLLDP